MDSWNPQPSKETYNIMSTPLWEPFAYLSFITNFAEISRSLKEENFA